MSAPSNTLTACAFFLASLVADALSAINSVQHADVPSSLRGTSLALVGCFASPVVMRPSSGIFGALQRPVVGAILAAAAIGGLHHGGEDTRVFDALYVTLVGMAMMFLYSSGGVDESSKHVKGKNQDRAVVTSSSMLAGSMLLYANLRHLRAGLAHPVEVRNFHIVPGGYYNATYFETLGYAYASDTATVAVCFGAAAGVGAAVVLALHVHELHAGTGSVAQQLGVAALCQCVAALAASLTLGGQVDWLPAAFGKSACKADSDVCSAASASRRFAVANTQVAGLWLSALGLFALAYPPSARMSSPRDWTGATWTGALFATGAALASVLVIYFESSFEGTGEHVEYTAIATVVAIWISAFGDTLLGTLVYLGAFFWEEVLYVEDFGIEHVFSQLTHVVLFCSALLLLAHISLTTAAYFLRSEDLRVVAGYATVLGASLTTALFCTAAALLMASSGAYDTALDVVDSGTRAALSYTLNHFLPAFIYIPLYACRCETNLLTTAQKRIAWVSAVLVALVVYGLVVLFLGRSPVGPNANQGPLSMAALGAGLLPWALSATV